MTLILSLVSTSTSVAFINKSSFQSNSETLELTKSCRSDGSLLISTGHNRLMYESGSTTNDCKPCMWELILSNTRTVWQQLMSNLAHYVFILLITINVWLLKC